MKIKSAIFIMFLLMTIIPFTILGLVDAEIFAKQTKQILRNDLGVATLTQVESIQNFIYERDVNISVISELTMTTQLLNSANENTNKNTSEYLSLRKDMDEILKIRSAKNENVMALFLLDKNYRLISSSEKIPDFPFEKTIKEIDFENNKNSVSFMPIFTDDTGKRHMILIKQIYDDENNITGYIAEIINMNFFEKARKAVSLFNNGTIYLLDGYNGIITAGSSNESLNKEITQSEERPDFNRAWNERNKSANHGTLEYTIGGHDYLSYYSDIDGTEWLMISTVNLSDVLQNEARQKDLVIVMLLLIFLGLIIINAMMSRKVVKPMSKMIAKFKEIQNSEDYAIRLDKIKHSELGTISNSINGLLQNIEEHIKKEHEQQRELIVKATHDSLTGLYNKKAMDIAISKTLEKANSEKRKIALLFIDIDNFKSFNTIYGHNGGDVVLRFVANSLKQTSELSGRMGGDEFVVCYESEEQMKTLDEIAKNLLVTFENGVTISDDDVHVQISCSMGVAISKAENQTYEELISIADNAMYHIKGSGKNGYDIVE